MPLQSAHRGWVVVFAATLLLIQSAAVLAQSQPPSGQLAPQPAQAPVQPPAAQGAPQSPDPQSPAPEAPAKRGNMFDAIGRWWDKSTSDFKRSVEENNAKWNQSVEENNAKWRQSVEENNAKWRELNARNEKAAKEAAAASREAAEAFKSLTNTKLVEGRQVCEISSNGAPDCQTAAEVFCKSKGFSTGKSADITTTRKCSMRSILDRDSRECKVETVMIKAACQ